MPVPGMPVGAAVAARRGHDDVSVRVGRPDAVAEFWQQFLDDLDRRLQNRTVRAIRRQVHQRLAEARK